MRLHYEERKQNRAAAEGNDYYLTVKDQIIQVQMQALLLTDCFPSGQLPNQSSLVSIFSFVKEEQQCVTNTVILKALKK